MSKGGVFRSLETLSYSLCEDPLSGIEKGLSAIGNFLDIPFAALVKKLYEDSDKFNLHVLGSWAKPNADRSNLCLLLEFLRPDAIPDTCWEKLNEGKWIILKQNEQQDIGSNYHKLLIPLFLNDHLFGFLVLFFSEGGWFGLKERQFLRVARSILELWIQQLNLRKQYEDFIHFMPIPAFGINVEGKLIVWNKETEDLTGWKAEEVLGKGNYEHSIPFYGMRRPAVPDLILNPDKKWERTYLEFHREGDCVYSLTYCPSLPRGPAYLRLHTVKFRDLNNRVQCAMHYFRDVTYERQMKQDLDRSESMYRAIADFAGVGIMLLRKEDIIYCNDKFAYFLGMEEEDIRIEHLLDWIHPDDRASILSHFSRLFEKKEEPSRFEFRARCGEDIRYFKGYTQVIVHEDQPMIHFIVDDITEQKELAEKARINELRLYHEDRLTSLGIMAAGIAHELNQPLNTIRVVTDGLLFGRDQGWDLDLDELYDHLEMISRQVVRMSQVIQNIRDFARDEQGKNLGEVDLNSAVKNVFSMIGRQLEAHGIEVRKDLSVYLPTVWANMHRLEQVIMNLLVNARQALDGCGKEKKMLWIKTVMEDGHVILEVGDNATGIPEEILSKIFDPFFTTKEVGKGTGLGLSISQSIVAECKGRIDVHNNHEGGATFRVILPASGGLT